MTVPWLTEAIPRSPEVYFGGGPDFSLVSIGRKKIVMVHLTCASITHSGTTRSMEVFPMEGGDTVVALCSWKEMTRWWPPIRGISVSWVTLAAPAGKGITCPKAEEVFSLARGPWAVSPHP